MLGNFAGGICGLVFTVNGVTDITGIYYFLAGMMFVSMVVTVIFVKEPPVTKVPPPLTAGEVLRGLYDPLKNHDFRWVFFTRLRDGVAEVVTVFRATRQFPNYVQ